MRTSIDKAGDWSYRALRDQIGLAAGGEVEIELDGASVRIAAVAANGLNKVAGLLVIPATGAPLTGDVVRELLDAERSGR